MAAIRGILFDCFHTLIDLQFDRLPVLQTASGPVRSSAPALHKVLQDFGYNDPVEKVHQALVATWLRSEDLRRADYREISARERLGWLLEDLEIEADNRLVELLEETHSESLLQAMVPIKGAEELLQTLYSRLPIGMVSNFDRTATVLEALRRLDLAGYFTCVVVSESAGVVKPHPKIFAAGAAGLGLPPEEILFVGDQPLADIQGARDAGMHTIWYGYRPEQKDELPIDCKVVYRLQDLTQAIINAHNISE